MSLSSWQIWWKGRRIQGYGNQHRKIKPTRPVRQRFAPRLEALEDRTMLSTFTVLNLNDSGSGSLRQAILDANDNPGADTIRFAVSGTIALTSGQLTVTDDLTINGRGRITVSGNHSSRVFQILDADPSDANTTDVELKHVSIVNGLAVPDALPFAGGGGIQSIGSNLTLSHVTMANNEAFASLESGGVATAGAIDSFLGGSLVIEHSKFYDNSATGALLSAGGAILVEGSLTVSHSKFRNNQATTFMADGSLLPDFQGAAVGGAISAGSGSDVRIVYSDFAGNVARGGEGPALPGLTDGSGGLAAGGAIFSSPISLVVPNAPGTLSVEHSSFRDNRAIGGAGTDGTEGGDARGGAIESTFLITASIANSSFLSNEAVGGAGGNGADGVTGGLGGAAVGGAVANGGGALTIERSAFLKNKARGGDGGTGGADANGGDGEVAVGGAVASDTHPLAPNFLPVATISRSLFASNVAQAGMGGAGTGSGNGGDGARGVGGAISNFFGTMTIDQSILTSNQATAGGGGAGGATGRGGNGLNALGGAVHNNFGGVLTVSSTLVVANRATGGDGAANGGNGGNGHGGGIHNGAADGTSTTIIGSWIIGNRAIKGVGGSGGVDGESAGGGVYNLGDVDIDARTHIFANIAELFENCFGC
jgi:hypothetical protein